MLNFKVLMCSLIILTTLFSCSKEDESKDDMTPEPCTATTLKETMIGKWKMAANGFSIEFKADNTYIDTDNFFNQVDLSKGPYTFRYSVSGNIAELEAKGSSSIYEDLRIDRFVCDTLFVTRPGFSKSPLIRQK